MITRRDLIKKSAQLAVAVIAPPVLANQVPELPQYLISRPVGVPVLSGFSSDKTLAVTFSKWSGGLKIIGAEDIPAYPEFSGTIIFNSEKDGGAVEVNEIHAKT